MLVDGIAKSVSIEINQEGILILHTWCRRRFCVHGIFEADRVTGKATLSLWTAKLPPFGHSDYRFKEHDKQHGDSNDIKITTTDEANSVMFISMYSLVAVGNNWHDLAFSLGGSMPTWSKTSRQFGGS